MQDNGYTNGEPYLVTHVETEGDRTRVIHYLLPDGSRRKVAIDVSHDSIHLRSTMGNSLARGEREYRK